MNLQSKQNLFAADDFFLTTVNNWNTSSNANNAYNKYNAKANNPLHATNLFLYPQKTFLSIWVFFNEHLRFM